MALIKCLECGNDVSDIASFCPNCGFPIKLKEKIEYLTSFAYDDLEDLKNGYEKFLETGKDNFSIFLNPEKGTINSLEDFINYEYKHWKNKE